MRGKGFSSWNVMDGVLFCITQPLESPIGCTKIDAEAVKWLLVLP